MMGKDQIKAIFLANGFKEKPQADGSTDLNPYVYVAAQALADAVRHGTGFMLVSAEGAEHVPREAVLITEPEKKSNRFMMTYSWSATGMIKDVGCGPYVELVEVEALRDELGRYKLGHERLGGTIEQMAGVALINKEVGELLQQRLAAAEQRIASLHHVGMELMGVIDEYRAMPCDSLKLRMFQTADRYRLRLTAKCQTCKDKGVVYNDFNEVEGRFSPEPCPDCAKPAEPGARNEQ